MGIPNPEELDEQEYYKAYAEWLYLRKLDREYYLGILKQAINEALTGTSEE